MKKKVKIQPSVPFYTTEPAVSRTEIAAKPLIPNASLANAAPKTVDKKPAKMSGTAGFVSKHGPRHGASGISPPKLGTPAKMPQQGKLRVSGHSGAHRIGSKSKI